MIILRIIANANANTNATTASVTTQENNSNFMSNVMLLSPLNDDGSNSLTSTPSVAMETDQSVYDLQKDMQQQQQQRPAGEFKKSFVISFDFRIYIHFAYSSQINVNIIASVVAAGTTSATPPSNSASDSGNGSGNGGSGSSEKVMQPPEELPYFPEKWPGNLLKAVIFL